MVFSLAANEKKKASRSYVFLLIFLLVTVTVILLRRAWICDDAYITFRTVDNFIHGYRLTWNVTERVQAYTHPLWMFLISFLYWISGEIFLTALALSLAVTLGMLFLLGWQVSTTKVGAVLVLVGLSLSKSFIDYSTSGLENPLSHLLIIIFFIFFMQNERWGKGMFLLSLVASLSILNRMDLGLILFPALVFTLARQFNRKTIGAFLLGQIPFMLWELFSLIYYGFPFPNTAYAKLNTGIPTGEYIQQGLLYLLNALDWDPITLLIITAGLLSTFFQEDRRMSLLGVGGFLYLGYIVFVGGDFMSGRFLTVPLVVAAIGLARFDFNRLPGVAIASLFGCLIVVGLSVSNATWHISDYGKIDQGPVHIGSNGILDERMLYYGGTGLLNAKRHLQLPNFYWAQYGEAAKTEGRKLADNYGIGMFGFYAGPQVYVIDKLALADSLLARLPAPRKIDWRIGHLERAMPAGYYQTLLSGKNMIQDSDLSIYYDKLTIITKGSLFSFDRLIEIWKMNTGQYNGLIHRDAFLYPDMVFLKVEQVSRPVPIGTACNAASVTPIDDSGAEIRFGKKVELRQLDIGLDHNDQYMIEYYEGDKHLASQIIPTAYLPDPGGISPRIVTVPKNVMQKGMTRIRIFPLAGDGTYCFGYVLSSPTQ